MENEIEINDSKYYTNGNSTNERRNFLRILVVDLFRKRKSRKWEKIKCIKIYI